MKKILAAALIILSFISPSLVSAAPNRAVTVEQNEAALDFPNSVSFYGRFRSDSQITDVTLEYGTTALTCGTVVAKARPDFTPGEDVRVEWTWDMRQSGSLPTGATIWWQWVVEDASGVTRTPRETVTWLDDQHDWKTISGGNANLHWYEGSQSFGQQLHDAATRALERMEVETGLKAAAPVDLYIYGDFTEMRDAILYEPGWAGGIAYSEYNSVSIGIPPDEVARGRSTIAHELTHVLVGHLTFSCLTSVPTWVSEGLAVYGEGRLPAAWAEQLQAAIDEDTLLPVRSLGGGFSEVPEQATLAYSESYSLVNFLVETHGREEMTDLLLHLRDGVPIDDALTAVYGFDVVGLEDAWRASIGARPREAVGEPTALPTPTIVPTIVPFAGVSSEQMQATQTSLGVPTATAIPPPPVVTPTSPGSGVTGSLAVAGGLGAACCLGLLILGVVTLLVRNSRGGKNEPH